MQGVFNDDLNRARRQLVSSFEAKSASMTPVAAGTDIFGGLFAMKTLLESGSHAKSADKEVWIFSDMMNETAQLNMPALISRGPEQMLVIAKSRGLVVDLTGYHVHILGVALSSSTPSMWSTSKRFWEQYFKAAGATLVTYSAENEPGR